MTTHESQTGASAPSAGLLLLAALLGAAHALGPHALGALLDDTRLLAFSCALGLALALGSAALALVPSLHADARARRLRARAGWTSALSLLPAIALAHVLLGAGFDVLAALAMALPVCAAGCAFAAELCLSPRRSGLVAAAWFAAAAAGLSGALLGLGGSIALTPDALGARPRGASFEARVATSGLNAQARGTALDVFGRWQSFALLTRSGARTGAGALLRDAALDAPLLRADSPFLRASCGSRMLRLPLPQQQQRVLIAGLAGGAGLSCALLGHATHVDVAEPSPARERLVRAFVGATAEDPRVHYYRAAPRAFVRRGDARGYDVIALETARGGHSAPPGLLPLVTDTLRTDAGLAALISALAPHGVLLATARGEPQALRLANTARAALTALGVTMPETHIAVHAMGDVYSLTVARSPLGIDKVLEMHNRDGEVAARSELADPAFAPLLGLPGAPKLLFTAGPAFQNRFRWLLASDGKRLSAEYAFDLTPPTDDRPLFDEQTRHDRPETWSDTTLYATVPQLLATAAVAAFALLLGVGLRSRPPRVAVIAVAFVSLGAAQALGYGYLNHALVLRMALPEHGLALAALALPLLALLAAPFPLAPASRPYALAAQILGAAMSVPLASWLVLLRGYGSVGLAACALLVVAAGIATLAARGAGSRV